MTSPCAARSRKYVWIRIALRSWCRRIGGWVPWVGANALRVRLGGWVGPLCICECAANPTSPTDRHRRCRRRCLCEAPGSASSAILSHARRIWSCREGVCSLHMLGNITSARIPICSWLHRVACSGLENVHAALTSKDVTAINRQQEVCSQKESRKRFAIEGWQGALNGSPQLAMSCLPHKLTTSLLSHTGGRRKPSAVRWQIAPREAWLLGLASLL